MSALPSTVRVGGPALGGQRSWLAQPWAPCPRLPTTTPGQRAKPLPTAATPEPACRPSAPPPRHSCRRRRRPAAARGSGASAAPPASPRSVRDLQHPHGRPPCAAGPPAVKHPPFNLAASFDCWLAPSSSVDERLPAARPAVGVEDQCAMRRSTVALGQPYYVHAELRFATFMTAFELHAARVVLSASSVQCRIRTC